MSNRAFLVAVLGIAIISMSAEVSCGNQGAEHAAAKPLPYYTLAGATIACLDGVEYWVIPSMNSLVPDSMAVRIEPRSLRPTRCEGGAPTSKDR